MCVCVVCVCVGGRGGGQLGFIVCREKGGYHSAVCFRLARKKVNRHFLTSNASAGNTILYHKLRDDWIALEQAEVNREQTNSCLECDPLLRRIITSVGVEVFFQNI